MIIMPANNGSGINHYFAGKYPDKIALLYTPFSYRNPPIYMPFALDNGCFTRWDEEEFFKMLERVKLLKTSPIFVCVPDVVADAVATTERWYKYYHMIDFPLAFVAQDGHKPWDVPPEAFAVFIGGSTEWKLKNAHHFKGAADWLHIGRVNTKKRLDWAKDIGADSVDGTGFFRGRGKQYYDYIEHFEGPERTEAYK